MQTGPYLRRTKRVEEFISWLYLKGIRNGEMGDTLKMLLGDTARGVTPAFVSKLKQWSKRCFDGQNPRSCGLTHLHLFESKVTRWLKRASIQVVS